METEIKQKAKTAQQEKAQGYSQPQGGMHYQPQPDASHPGMAPQYPPHGQKA